MIQIILGIIFYIIVVGFTRASFYRLHKLGKIPDEEPAGMFDVISILWIFIPLMILIAVILEVTSSLINKL